MSDEEMAKIFYLETRQRSDTPDIEARIIWAHSAGLRAGREEAAVKVEAQPDVEVWNSGVIQASPTRIRGAISREKTAAAIRGGGG